MPLTDITNAVASRNSEDAGGGVKKTFARKNRPPSETTKSTPLAGLGPIASPEASTPSPSPDGQEDAPVAKERAQCAWLSRRRSSCIMPFRMQQNAEKVAGGGAARRKRADKKAQQRQAELQAFLLRMRQHYAEVDAYELVEEEEVEDDKQEDAGRKTGPVSAAAVRATAREKRVVPPVPEQRSSDAAASPPCQPAAAGADLRATTPWSGAATAADLRCRQEEDEEAGAVAAASSSSSPAQADSGACGSLDSLSDSNSPDVMPLDHAAAAQSQLLPQVAPAGRPSLAGRRSSVVIPADTRLSLSMAPGRPSLARRGSMAAPPLAEEGKEEKDDGGTRPSATLNPNRLSVAASGRASLAGPRHSLLISDKRMSLLPPAMAAGRKSSLLPGRPSMLPARQSLAPQPPLLLPEEEEEEEGSQAHPAKAAAAAQEEEEEEEETTAEEDADAAAVRDQAPALSPLQQLLQLCGQGTDAAAIPSMDALLAQHAEVARITKIGEGTYGKTETQAAYARMAFGSSASHATLGMCSQLPCS